MAVATPPVVASRKQLRAWIALMLVLLFGVLSLAAVRKMKVECVTVLLIGAGKLLTEGRNLLTGGQRCQLVVGDEIRVPLPTWAAADHQVIRRCS
jgi:intracellular septation protein A